MVANPVLVDSSYYIDQLRQKRPLIRELLRIASIRPLAVCGAIQCEVGRGIRVESLRNRLRTLWSSMLYVPTDNRIWANTDALLWKLDRTGVIIPLTDGLIAECARRINAVVLTSDSHFRLIPGIVAVDRIV